MVAIHKHPNIKIAGDPQEAAAAQPSQPGTSTSFSSKVAVSSSSSASTMGQPDPLLVAYFLLLQTTNVSSDTAMIQAKQLNQNAISQQKINNKMAQIQNYTVPREVVNHHTTYIPHTHWTWKFWKHGFHYTTYQKVTWNTYPNGANVQQVEAKNQQLQGQRQILSDQLTVLQQSAQIQEANVNTTNNNASQSMQEDSGIMQMLQTLTFAALLRQQPQ